MFLQWSYVFQVVRFVLKSLYTYFSSNLTAISRTISSEEQI